MISAFFPFFLTFFSLWAMGFFVQTLFRKAPIFADQTLPSAYVFVLGLISFSSILALLSLFVPINFWVKTSILIFLSIFWIVFQTSQGFKNLVGFTFFTNKVFFYPFLFFLIIFLSHLALPFNYDTGLYHLQAIQWTENEAVVFGLGNLHGRLAFNSHFFLLAAFFNFLPQNFYALNAVLLFAFAIYCTKKIHKPLYFSALLFVFYFYYKWISSPTPDILATLLIFFILLETSEKLQTQPEIRFDFEWFVILSAACFLITLKLSNLPILLVFGVFFIRKQVLKIPFLKKMEFFLFSPTTLFFLFFNLTIFSLWLVRNVILSGYLIYPLPALDLFSFDWKIPIEKVIEEKFLIEIWAKIPPDITTISRSSPLPFSEWFPIWLKARPNSLLEKILFFGTLFFSILVVFKNVFFRNTIFLKNGISLIFGKLTIWFISLCGIIFWFLTAPDFRFAHGFLAVGFVTSIILVFPFLETIFEKYHLFFQKTALFFFGIYGLILVLLFFNPDFSTYPVFKKIAQTVPIHYQKHGIFPEPYPTAVCDTVKIEEDFSIFVPQTDPRCWASPLPCTPKERLDNQLVRRGKTLREGFKIGTK